MKKILFILVVTSFAINLSAQTTGILTVSATTSGTGSSGYGTNNIVSMWVEDNSGKFTKTLLALAAERKQYLKAWKATTTIASSVYNTVDAVTGATQSSHGTRTCTWNGKNRLQVLMADGTYTLKMELTDNDGAKQNLASFQFIKGTTEQILTPSTTSGFSNIKIKWTPTAAAGIDEIELSKLYSVYPNPTKSFVFINGLNIKEIVLTTLSGKLILTSNNQNINLSKIPKGIYLAIVKTEKGTITKKIAKE